MFRCRRESMNTKLSPNTKLFSGQFKVAFALTLFTSNWAMSSRGGALGAAFAFSNRNPKKVIPSLDIKLICFLPVKNAGREMILEPLWETWLSGAMLVSGRVSTCLRGNTIMVAESYPDDLPISRCLPKTIIPSHHITLQRTNISHPWKFGKSSTQKCRLVGDMFVPKRATNLVESTPNFSCPISLSFSPLARAHEVELHPSRKDLVPGGSSRGFQVQVGWDWRYKGAWEILEKLLFQVLQIYVRLELYTSVFLLHVVVAESLYVKLRIRS